MPWTSQGSTPSITPFCCTRPSTTVLLPAQTFSSIFSGSNSPSVTASPFRSRRGRTSVSGSHWLTPEVTRRGSTAVAFTPTSSCSSTTQYDLRVTARGRCSPSDKRGGIPKSELAGGTSSTTNSALAIGLSETDKNSSYSMRQPSTRCTWGGACGGWGPPRQVSDWRPAVPYEAVPFCRRGYVFSVHLHQPDKIARAVERQRIATLTAATGEVRELFVALQREVRAWWIDRRSMGTKRSALRRLRYHSRPECLGSHLHQPHTRT